jgi:hypothetical protein
MTMKLITYFLLLFVLGASGFAAGRPKDAFDGSVYDDLPSAIAMAAKKHKPVFAIVYDNRSKTKSRVDVIASFLSTKAERELLNRNFVQALVSLSSPSTEKYFTQTDPLELCEILVISEDGKLVTHRPITASLGRQIIESLLAEVAKAKSP